MPVTMDGTDTTHTVQWSSRVEYVVALLGYSVGAAGFWRVPYLTYRNGGGAFIIVYILMMLICGLPLFFLELALSQYSGKGPWKIWDICPLLRGIGIATAIINGLCAINIAISIAWGFEYFVNSFKPVLPWTNCDNDWNTQACYRKGYHSTTGNVSLYNATKFNDTSYDSSVMRTNESHIIDHHPMNSVDEFWWYRVLRISDGIDHLGSISVMFVVYLFGMRVIAAIGIFKSIESLGKFLYVTTLLPAVLVLIMWFRALSLPGSTDGMKYCVSADFTKLANAQIWIEAAFQTFFELGPGWGGLFMIGAHNKFRTNCFRASVVSTAAVMLYGILNTLVVFSVLGVMSAEIGVPIADFISSGGFSIGFIAYPKALSYFPLPQLWCVIFFLAVLLPGLDALVVLTEPFLMVLEDIFPKFLKNRRLPLLLVVSVILFLLSLPLATQAGVYIFLLVNWYVATWSLVLICLVECLLFAWIYGGHRVDRDIRLMLRRPFPAVVRISTAFIMPVFFTVVNTAGGLLVPEVDTNLFLLMVSIVTYKPPVLGEYTYPVYARAIGWCFALASVIPGFGYCVWLTAKSEGTIIQRLRHLSRHTSQWGPANDKVEESHRQTEESAEYTWRQLFWFNLTGKGGLVIEDRQDTFLMQDIHD